MSHSIRQIVEEELDAYIESVVRAFGGEVRDGEQDRVRQAIGLDRTYAAFDHRNRIVGTTGSYAMQLAVPGAVDVSTAGLTRVTVAASHRRQGILTEMMDAHFDATVADNEPLSILWASEVAIYGRFGYGQTSENLTVTYDARLAKIRRPDQPDDIDLIDVPEAQKALPEIRERSRIKRPGLYHRPAQWWEIRNFPDYEWMRDGASPRRHVLARRDGEPVGYVSYRQKEHWNDNDIPEGTITLIELVAIDDRAMHTLWWFLSNVDLFPKVQAWLQPTDCILPSLAENPRAIKRNVTDGIHLRVLDVEAALSARRYDVAGELAFSVDDPQRPELSGTYELTVAADGVGHCRRSQAPPQATLTPYALGALYLGAGKPETLAYTGHIEASSETVARIRRIFTWPVAPFCDEGF